jgi:hypothetical protein
MGWRHHDLIKPIELNFERKITKARISANIFPSQFLAEQHAQKLQLEGAVTNREVSGRRNRQPEWEMMSRVSPGIKGGSEMAES